MAQVNTLPEIIVPPRLVRTGIGQDEMHAAIVRLQRRCIVELEQMQQLHQWLDNKRLSRQACRVIGESRTGKTFACDAYRLRHLGTQENGEAPKVPVLYWHCPPECTPRELFVGILDYLQYQITRGTVDEIRARVYHILKACQVEMIVLDEAHRLRPKTFSEVSDIFDQLRIAVVLVGTDRLDAVVRRDEQVHHRFMACHRFHRLNAAQLEETTAIWEEYVLKLPESSNLGSEKMQLVLGQATRGYIGLLDMILRESAIQALKQGQARIDLATLTQVAAEYR